MIMVIVEQRREVERERESCSSCVVQIRNNEGVGFALLGNASAKLEV